VYLVSIKSLTLPLGLHEIDHYLDDFLFAGADKTSNCSKLMNTFTEVCSQLGVPIADDKTEGPSTMITCLGLLIDTEKRLHETEQPMGRHLSIKYQLPILNPSKSNSP
jgi:hypothetical protein